jgi:hypothetical protein
MNSKIQHLKKTYIVMEWDENASSSQDQVVVVCNLTRMF